MSVTVKLFNGSPFPDPQYETLQSAGMDLRANLSAVNDPEAFYTLYPGNMMKIPTGIFVAIPDGYEIQVRPRSGLAAKNQVTVMNSPGTIDADYRGEIIVMLYNAGKDSLRVSHGDRIAQIVLNHVPRILWHPIDEKEGLGSTDRGTGGFGSTGK